MDSKGVTLMNKVQIQIFIIFDFTKKYFKTLVDLHVKVTFQSHKELWIRATNTIVKF